MKSLKQISYMVTNITTEHAINMQELCLIDGKSKYKVPSKLLKAKRNIGDFSFSKMFNRFKENPLSMHYKQYQRSFRGNPMVRHLYIIQFKNFSEYNIGKLGLKEKTFHIITADRMKIATWNATRPSLLRNKKREVKS